MLTENESCCVSSTRPGLSLDLVSGGFKVTWTDSGQLLLLLRELGSSEFATSKLKTEHVSFVLGELAD